jgi:hypothetical protein
MIDITQRNTEGKRIATTVILSLKNESTSTRYQPGGNRLVFSSIECKEEAGITRTGNSSVFSTTDLLRELLSHCPIR